ncbi:MAG: hypothetical protein JHD33_00585 [Chthoniobacterales bacterium]|nr:hypothetical protein [Chthoniobacterales bacterium]
MKRFLLPVLVCAALPLLASCSLLPKWGDGWFGLVKKKPEAPEATLPTWIGRVVMVDAGNKFALVDTGAPMRLAPGRKLLAFREKQRTALLETTAETRPPFLAVQLLEGVPAMGDQVALDESRPPEAMPVN